MKFKILSLLTAFLLVCIPLVKAASYQDIATICHSTLFQDRCYNALITASVNVMAEDKLTNMHVIRVAYGAKILNGNINLYNLALSVASNPTIAAEMDATKLGTTSGVPDSDIQFAVNSLFNALAGIGT